jgi:ATP-dependent protease ClpP protease subunit
MPTRGEIQQEILLNKRNSQDIVRKRYLRELHENTKRDVIVYASAFTAKKMPALPSGFLSFSLDDVQAFMTARHQLKGDELDLILHSPGGILEAAEQIVLYLRKHYKHIRVIIPQNAMSVATMLACAADEIVMGSHSAIGPIDPQITFPTQNGLFTAPAQTILDEFEQAKREVIADQRVSSIWINKINSIPPGFLQICINSIKLSKTKVAEWLDTYMFKNSEPKGKKIADWLVSNQKHLTHSRPINIDQAIELGLKVTPLEDDHVLQELVLSLFHATMITLEITDCVKIVENHLGKGTFVKVRFQQPIKQN